MIWTKELINDIARRKVVIFIGSGISKNSVGFNNKRPPLWKELLEIFVNDLPDKKRHIQSLIKNGDLLTACEILKDRLGKERFNSILNEEFSEPNYQSADIHEVIFRLDSRIVITPNFDKIYDVFATNTDSSIKVKKYYDSDLAEAIRRPQRLIMKIHGCIDNTDSLIFTRSEYAKAKSKQNDFYKILESLILTHTFLFLGCGLDDPDIRLLLEDYNFRFKSGRNHYFVLPQSQLHEDHRKAIENSLGLKLIHYKTKNENHTELLTQLNELNGLVERERDHLIITRDW